MPRTPKIAAPSSAEPHLHPAVPALVSALIAIVVHLQVVKTCWFHDDWYFLAQAAGVAVRGTTPVRFVSYDWYWAILYRLFGLGFVWWGVTRLLLHAGCAILVTRILARVGGSRPAQVVGGILFAASPLAFEAVYWGTGAVELLGAFLALAAFERWLSGGRRGTLAALLLGALAIFSKESGMALPVLFALLLLARRSRDRLGWATVGILAIMTVVEVRFLALDTRDVTTYAPQLGSIPLNLLRFGWWLIAPAPQLDSSKALTVVQGLLGGGLWVAWGGLGVAFYRRGRPLCLACALAALLVVAPSTPLGMHLVPRYLYPAVAPLAVCLAALFFPPGSGRSVPTVLAIIALSVSGWNATAYQMNARWPDGQPLHRLVLKRDISNMATPVFKALPTHHPDRIVIVRDPKGSPAAHQLLYDAVGGEVGPRVLLGKDITVTWTDHLEPSYAGSLLLAEFKVNLMSRGRYTPPATGQPAPGPSPPPR